MSSVNSNRPLRELVAEAKAEVMEEIEHNSEEGEEDEPIELTGVCNIYGINDLGIFLLEVPVWYLRECFAAI